MISFFRHLESDLPGEGKGDPSSESCFSVLCLSITEKEVTELEWKRLKIGFLIILEGTTWNITREIICTQLPSRTFRMMMHTLFYPLIYEQQIYSLIFSSKATKVFLSHILISLSLSLSLSQVLSFFIALPILYLSYYALFWQFTYKYPGFMRHSN